MIFPDVVYSALHRNAHASRTVLDSDRVEAYAIPPRDSSPIIDTCLRLMMSSASISAMMRNYVISAPHEASLSI